MLLIVCFCISIALFILIVTLTRKQPLYIRVRYIGGAVGLSILFLLLPYYMNEYADFRFGGFVSSVIYALQASQGKKDGTEVLAYMNMEYPIWFIKTYCYYTFTIVLLAPLVTIAFLTSFFGKTFDRIVFAFTNKKKALVFSELNNNSLTIASTTKKRCIFCNVNAKSNKLVSLARVGNNAIIQIDILKVISKNPRYDANVILINEDQNESLKYALALEERYEKYSNKKLQLYILSEKKEAEYAVDQMLTNLLEQHNDRITIQLHSDKGQSISNLLTTYKLLPDKSNNINVLTIGAGRMGKQFILDATWCSQFKDVTYKMNVIDKNANKISQEFFINAPEMKEYNINFHQADTLTDDFEQLVIEYGIDANYIFVALGNDDLNTQIALYIKRLLLRKKCTIPKTVFVKVLDGRKKEFINKLASDQSLINFKVFGIKRDIYKYDNVANLYNLNLAKGVHLAYCNCLEASPEEQTKALKTFNLSQYNMRSSMSSAIHLLYKLAKHNVNLNNIEAIRKCVEQNKDYFAYSEHLRWNAFMRTEGYICASQKDVEDYFVNNQMRHINSPAKLHPCLVTWDELDNVTNFVNDIYKKHQLNKVVDFKEYDYFVVNKIPEIVKYANEHTK